MSINQVIFTFALLIFTNISNAQEVAKDESEIEVSEKDCQCTPEEGLPVSEQFATLEQRAIGTPLLDEDGKPVIWPRALPFFAQNVLDLGFELPKTFGIAIIPNRIRQDLVIENLKLGINGSEPEPLEFVNFGTSFADNSNVQIKADVWLFPFLNLYATYGEMTGSGEVPLAMEGKDFLEFLGIDCDGFLTPAACDRRFAAVAKPNYRGSNYSIGFTLAMGWDRFFVALPVTYAVSSLDILSEDVESLLLSPRIGISSDVGKWGTMSTFVGVTYLDAEVDIVGEISFDTGDVEGLEEKLWPGAPDFW